MTLLMFWCDCIFNTSQLIRNLLGFCCFSGGQRLGFVAVCCWNAQKNVYMFTSYFSVSSVFPFEFFWMKKIIYFKAFFMVNQRSMVLNIYSKVFPVSFSHSSYMSICLCRILVSPLYFLLSSFGLKTSFISCFHIGEGVFERTSTEKCFVLLLCRISLCRYFPQELHVNLVFIQLLLL